MQRFDCEFAIEGGTLTVTAPLRPGTASVVTRYVVGYDRAGDAYTLSELTAMYREAGFGDIAGHPVPTGPHTVVVGRAE